MSTDAFSITLTKAVAVDFLTKMTNAIGSKNPKIIKQFFEYYATPTSRFINAIEKISINNTVSDQQSKKEVNFSREEYIGSLTDISKNAKKFFYSSNLTDFQYDDAENYAVISFAAEQSVYNSKKADGKILEEKILSKLNCNLSITIPVSDPQIQGMNCIEKTVTEILDSSK